MTSLSPEILCTPRPTVTVVAIYYVDSRQIRVVCLSKSLTNDSCYFILDFNKIYTQIVLDKIKTQIVVVKVSDTKSDVRACCLCFDLEVTSCALIGVKDIMADCLILWFYFIKININHTLPKKVLFQASSLIQKNIVFYRFLITCLS